MADAEVLGQVLWYELLTTDVKAAEAFYTDIVGWTADRRSKARRPRRLTTSGSVQGEPGSAA